MQAIVTKYLPPTNHRGARVKVIASTRAVTIPWDYALDVPENHASAVRIVINRWGWSGHWAGGELPNATGYAFVLAGRDAHALTVGVR